MTNIKYSLSDISFLSVSVISKINKTLVSFLVLFKNNDMFEHINKYTQPDPGSKLYLPLQVEKQISRLKVENRMNVYRSFPGRLIQLFA